MIVDFEKAYLDALDYAVNVFLNDSWERLTTLTEEEKVEIRDYLKSDAARNNSDLKGRVIMAIKGGLELLPSAQNGKPDDYKIGDKSSVLFISGPLGAYARIDQALKTGQGFEEIAALRQAFPTAVVINFGAFKPVMNGLSATPALHYNGEADHNRARAIFSGIDGALGIIALQLQAQVVRDNKLDFAQARVADADQMLVDNARKNGGNLQIVGMAMTKEQTVAQPLAAGKAVEAETSAVNYAQYLQSTLTRVDEIAGLENVEVSIFDYDGKMIYHRSADGKNTFVSPVLGEIYKDCGVETSLGIKPRADAVPETLGQRL